jgi:hypothetical protein
MNEAGESALCTIAGSRRESRRFNRTGNGTGLIKRGCHLYLQTKKTTSCIAS